MADASRALTAYAGVPTSVASGDAQGEVRPAPTGFHRASAASSNPDRFPSRVRRFVEPRPVSIARPPPFRLVHPSPAARSDADRPVTSLGHSWTSTTSFASTTPRRGGGRLQRSPIRQQGRPRRCRRARRRARRRRAHGRRDRFFQRPRRRRRVRRRPSRRRRHRGRRAIVRGVANTPEAIAEANAGKRWDPHAREWVTEDLVEEALRLAKTTDEEILEGAARRAEGEDDGTRRRGV